jgi:hypothetical protein
LSAFPRQVWSWYLVVLEPSWAVVGVLVGWQAAASRPVGQAGCGLPVLSVYGNVEKPSMAQGFRVPKFQLSLVLYLSHGCLQHLRRSFIPGAHAVCICVPVTILDSKPVFAL